ncbi:hypothetical protein IFR05_003690 [Cadophora sp. M221]|nr:hypothetical protein IFR05_003690 [Cadophora sp. M221]
MTITCPQESCSSVFESQEELTRHQVKYHSVGKAGSLPGLCATTSISIDHPSPTAIVDTESTLEENSVYEKPSPRLQEQLPTASKPTLKSAQDIDTPPKVETQSSTGSTSPCGNATNLVDRSRNQHHLEDEDAIIHCHEKLRIGMAPRSYDGTITITRRYTRSLEDGLKDSSTDELLGYSSSDQGSESEFSNYSY